MDKFHGTATNEIMQKLRDILRRELTIEEHQAFSIQRSGIAYEMMINYISDPSKSVAEIESYATSVVVEYKSFYKINPTLKR